MFVRLTASGKLQTFYRGRYTIVAQTLAIPIIFKILKSIASSRVIISWPITGMKSIARVPTLRLSRRFFNIWRQWTLILTLTKSQDLPYRPPNYSNTRHVSIEIRQITRCRKRCSFERISAFKWSNASSSSAWAWRGAKYVDSSMTRGGEHANDMQFRVRIYAIFCSRLVSSLLPVSTKPVY